MSTTTRCLSIRVSKLALLSLLLSIVFTTNVHARPRRNHSCCRCVIVKTSCCAASSLPSKCVQAGVASSQHTMPVSTARMLVSPKGLRYRITDSGQFDEEEEHDRPESFAARAAAGSENFAGTARKCAKTSIANAQEEEPSTLDELLASLRSDRSMIDRTPPISHAATSDRVAEETRNVTVDAFLYAASREEDNDFHLIIGNDRRGSQRQYMNVEISGLPASGPFVAPLKAARSQFKGFFAGELPENSYDFYEPAIPGQVSGSLFYDIDHRPGAVGPASLKPRTAWEIHPITDIEFETDDQ